MKRFQGTKEQREKADRRLMLVRAQTEQARRYIRHNRCDVASRVLQKAYQTAQGFAFDHPRRRATVHVERAYRDIARATQRLANCGLKRPSGSRD